MNRPRAAARLSAVSAALLAWAGTARAQTTPEPSRLETAVGAPGWLTLRGSLRGRYEALDGQFRPGGDGGDQLLTTRLLLFAQARSGPLRFAAELQDSRAALGDEGGTITTSEVNTLEPIQAHLGLTLDDLLVKGSRTDIVAGRFTTDLGSRRLVAVNVAPNTTTAFTGVRVTFEPTKADSLTLFHSHPQVRLPDDIPSLLDNEQALDRESAALRFSGAFYARKLSADTTAEAYAFDLRERDTADRPTRDRKLLTIGGRLFRKPAEGAWDAEVEAALQTGSTRASSRMLDTRDLDVRAGFVHLEVGRTLTAAWSPRISLEYDYASGDERAEDGAYGRFDPLFGSRTGDFGPSGVYGALNRANISSPGLRLEVQRSKRLDGFIAYRLLHLAEARDSFAGTDVRDPTGASGRHAGQHLMGQVRYALVPDSLRLEVGAAALLNGEFLERAPNATGEGDTLFGYADLTFSF